MSRRSRPWTFHCGQHRAAKDDFEVRGHPNRSKKCRSTGRDAVTVKRPERGPDGQLHPKEAEVFRNLWVIEKESFFEARAAAAQVFRDETVGPREAVRQRQHPELAGTYLNLRTAELASRALRDPEDQRRFVAQVRTALADDIERGNRCKRYDFGRGLLRLTMHPKNRT